jgi:hypothetical protein
MTHQNDSEPPQPVAEVESLVGVASTVLLGFDKGSDNGDRSGLSIGLTREQHAALMRADLPPGDPVGMKLKQEIADIRTKALAEDPRTVVHIFIREPNAKGHPTGEKGNENE